ncbi:MAG: UDP-N-acetylmuramate dehydrogenase [Candidatus Marinimicrobia bacterium]|jgi:UDP-N-acetylmuramate dehydrogenase|nr:UDP-N-acetylmuramate dehydrogenase [Candidatus Neomarinimicrobiota bacterium]MDP6726152.1 UDP-N-acetylmuramate dehydrogenase [Candidatus Neomarinimicrobiota bacterium]|tara:strand:+ start:43236 stop:44147 length:912 start_codon:yes stop_codon:yes gene_type:complete
MAELKATVKGKFLESEPMSKHTSYGIGGPAWAYITPKDKHDLGNLLRFATESDIPVYFVGSGSNLLVADEGIDGIVITLGKSFTHLDISNNHVYAETGVMLGRMVKECIKRNLSGLESMIGVPGTLGGALIMNAGAFGGEISNYLQKVEVMTLTGDLKNYSVDEIDFSYRHSSFNEDEIIISADFEMQETTSAVIQEKRSLASQGRKKNQPLRFRSAGSVFKNPKPDLAAGYLIDQAGLKGTRSGDAEISEKHANFFINHGSATANDIATLIRIARKEVKEKFDIILELEIKTLGFDKDVFTP